jgi:hypothetical protein
MKAFILVFALSFTCYGQDWGYPIWPKLQNNIVTDSVVWRVTDTLRIGDPSCNHIWIDGVASRSGSWGCLVDHNGWHCGWDDQTKSRICSKCLRKEQLREFWYQHSVTPPKTPYEMLQDSIDRMEKPKEIDGVDSVKSSGWSRLYGDSLRTYSFRTFSGFVDTISSFKLTVKRGIEITPDSLSPQPDYITLEDLLTYKAECWNDSTKQEKVRWRLFLGASNEDSMWVSCDDIISPLENGWKRIITTTYTHREPTFTGFIDWIERRRK